MVKDSLWHSPLKRIKSAFTARMKADEKRQELNIQAVQINFFLLNAALKCIEKGSAKKEGGSFISEVIDGKKGPFASIIAETTAACQRQDIELLFYMETFCYNKHPLRSATEWKFPKYLKSKEEIRTLIQRLERSTPENFKRHLITLFKGEEVTFEALERELNRYERECLFAKQIGSTLDSVPPI